MYKIFTANTKTEKILVSYLNSRRDVKLKLQKLKKDPYRNVGAHKLHGNFKGKLAAWLGSNIRIIYSIDETRKIIIIEAIGTHKIYG